MDEHNGTSTYTTEYQYDALAHLTNITDALSNIRAFTYDGLGRRLTAQDLHASGDSTYGTWLYSYDDTSNLASSTNPKSQNVQYTYDDINRVSTENYTGQGGTEVSYGYDTCPDGKGRLRSATTTAPVTIYEYNPLGLIKKETKKIDSVNYVTSFGYTRRGDIATTTYPDNSIVLNEYNPAGQLQNVKRKESSDSSYTTIFRSPYYTPIGVPEYYEYGDGSYTYAEYDAQELYRLRRHESVVPDTGLSGNGMPTFMGGDADGAL